MRSVANLQKLPRSPMVTCLMFPPPRSHRDGCCSVCKFCSHCGTRYLELIHCQAAKGSGTVHDTRHSQERWISRWLMILSLASVWVTLYPAHPILCRRRLGKYVNSRQPDLWQGSRCSHCTANRVNFARSSFCSCSAGQKASWTTRRCSG